MASTTGTPWYELTNLVAIIEPFHGSWLVSRTPRPVCRSVSPQPGNRSRLTGCRCVNIDTFLTKPREREKGRERKRGRETAREREKWKWKERSEKRNGNPANFCIDGKILRYCVRGRVQ